MWGKLQDNVSASGVSARGVSAQSLAGQFGFSTVATDDAEVFADKEVDATFVYEGGAGLVAFSSADGSIWQSADGIAWTLVDADGRPLTARGSGRAFTGDEFVLLGLTEDDRWTSWIWSQDG